MQPEETFNPGGHHAHQQHQPVVEMPAQHNQHAAPAGHHTLYQPPVYQPPAEQPAAGHHHRGQSGHKGLLWAAVATVAVVAAFVGGLYIAGALTRASQSNAATTARQFIADINAGDNAKAYSLTSTSLRTDQTEQQFSDNLGSLTATSPTVQSQQIAFSGKTAKFVMVEDGLPPTDSGTTTGSFRIALVKDGLLHWKVDSVNVE